MNHELRSIKDNRTPFILSFQKVLERHLVKKFRFNRFPPRQVHELNDLSHSTINSAFSFFWSSKNSFPPSDSFTSTS